MYMWVIATCVLAGPLDPVKSFVEGLSTELELQAPDCLLDSMQSDLLLTVKALAQDFQEEPSLPALYELYQHLLTVERACDLTTFRRNIGFKVGMKGIEAILTLLEGFGVQVLRPLLLHDWESAASEKALISPETDTVPSPDANFFQRLDNFTAGLFYGFIPSPNPKKPVACLATYNNTSHFFYQSANTLKVCIHLFINDCKAVRDLVPAAIINLQGLILSCKLQALYSQFQNLDDPTYWSQIAVSYYFNAQTINAKILDIKQSAALKKWYPVGVGVGTIIRLIFNFKLT